ncbi:MAG TPA: hypothetical protein ENH46_02590 [Candidatus Pacearchaeota archaeon]|nr:hypothetical protein [Candidatus Pacearchaeota archaeon]
MVQKDLIRDIRKTQILERKEAQRRIKVGRKFQPAPMLSKEQSMLHEMFNGNDNWGTGQNLPKMDGILRSGHGLINNEDEGDTGALFGLRR